MSQYGIDLRTFKEDDFSCAPECFKNDLDGHATVSSILNWGMFNVEDEKTPIYFMLHYRDEKFSSQNFIRLGDGPITPQESLHHYDIAQKDALVIPYHKLGVSEEYGLSSAEPFAKFRYNKDGASWQETDIFDVEVKWFPLGVFAHTDSQHGTPYFLAHHYFKGTYEGKPIEGVGCQDRYFKPNTGAKKNQINVKNYISMFLTGIREDGRKESLSIAIYGKNGSGLVVYYLEGEEPIVTDKVTIEADWRHLPYKKDDPSVAYTKAKVYFANKVLNFQGKWGSKGHTPTPRYELEGFSQTYGTWYVGEEAYKHVLNHSLCENFGMTDEVITNYGYTVIE